MLDFTAVDISAEELDWLRAMYEPLTQSVRELIDATIRTQAHANTVVKVKAQIDAPTASLRGRQLAGPFG